MAGKQFFLKLFISDYCLLYVEEIFVFEDQKHKCVFDSYNFAPLVLFLYLAQCLILLIP